MVQFLHQQNYLLKSYRLIPKEKKSYGEEIKKKLKEMFEKGECWYQKTPKGDQIFFKFFGDDPSGQSPKSIWVDAKYSASEHGTPALEEVLGHPTDFPFPKSVFAVKDCIEIGCSDKDGLVLDFFAGSATTGEAVFKIK